MPVRSIRDGSCAADAGAGALSQFDVLREYACMWAAKIDDCRATCVVLDHMSG